jgi:uncharacterized protein YidB (DUF937 family)
MTPNRKLLAGAAFSLALAGGGVAGAVFGTPNLSLAQDGSSSTTAPADAAPLGGPRGEHRGEGLAAAADALGMTAAELRTELQGGKSIAQVAADKGVDVQTVVDALVADATKRLDEMKASLPERMTELVNRTGWGEHDGPGGHHHGARRIALDTAAKAIGISAADLRTALEGGSTVAEVATAHGVEVQTVVNALVAEATTRIDAAVADGRLDADRAAQIKAELPDRITARVNGEDPGPGDGPFGEGPPDAPADSTD